MYNLEKVIFTQEEKEMIYKAVPGPTIVGIKKGNYQSAVDLFADVMNAQAADGWKFHSLQTLTTQEKVGCFLSKQIVNTEIYMLIFCKEQ